MNLVKRPLGATGLVVTELCFGALPMGPLQANLSVEQGGRLLSHAFDSGVNFVDTAAMYGTYPHIRRALELTSTDVVINSKSAAATYEDMRLDLEKSREQLGRYPDIFMLHAARVEHPFEARAGALQCLLDYRAQGRIRAVGISTHVVQVAEEAARHPDIDVVHPLINRLGMGILGGSVQQMSDAIAALAAAGKGVYAMKALAGGNGLTEFDRNIQFVRSLAGMTSIAIGMVSEPEVDMNLALFTGQLVSDAQRRRVLETRSQKRIVILQSACRGCGSCVKACPNSAMQIVDGKARPDPQKCLLCGYCAPACPEFGIRLV